MQKLYKNNTTEVERKKKKKQLTQLLYMYVRGGFVLRLTWHGNNQIRLIEPVQ